MKMWAHTNRSNRAAVALFEATGGSLDPSGDEVSFEYSGASLNRNLE